MGVGGGGQEAIDVCYRLLYFAVVVIACIEIERVWGCRETEEGNTTKCARILFIIWTIAHQSTRTHGFRAISVSAQATDEDFSKEWPDLSLHML